MITYFVFFVTAACLPLTALSFNFTRKPDQPMIVVLNSNSTNVDFRWDISLAKNDSFGFLNIKRYEKQKGLVATGVALGALYKGGSPNIDTTLYSLNTNISPGPSSGYVTFTIKDIMKQTDNKDGSKADPRSIEYVYRLEMHMTNLLQPAENYVELRVLFPPAITAFVCQGCQNGSAVENQTITLVCNATGKPMPNIRWMKNGEHYNGSSSVSNVNNPLVFQQVAINDKGNYTCIADNGVGNPDRESLTLLVKYKPTNTLISPTKLDVCVNTDITLNCTADAYPSVKNYSLYNGSDYLGSNSNGQFTTTARSLKLNTFCCVASNEIGSGQCAFSYVYVLGDITTLCKINNENTSVAAVKEGDKVVLQCDVTGNESYYIYQWIKVKDSLSVRNDTRQLSFGSINRTDEGYYQVTLRDKLNCSSQTRSFNITVNYKPENTVIKITPDKKNFCKGKSINIICTSDAKPAPVYSLYRNSVFNGSNGDGVFVVKLAENGNYTFTCVSNNTVGVGPKKSKNVTVRGPLIKTCKIGNETITKKTVVEGSDVILHLKSSEMERLGFTWNNNTVDMSGEVGHSLSIKPITRYQGGMYQVVARDKFNCSADMTCSFTFNVQYKPEQARIWFSPNKSTVNEGEALNMTCKAEANPKPYYTWSFKGNMIQSKINDTISFSSVTASDAGEYKCIAVNDLGSSTATKTLMVTYFRKPSCEAVPVIVKEGDNITLNCSASAYPPANYTWKSGNDIANTSIAILTASRDLLGKSFTCTAANSRKSKNCTTAPLNVLYKPRYVRILAQTLMVKEFGVVNLTCTTSSNPASNYTWTFNDRSIEGANSALLVKYNVSRYDAGEYKCTASNEFGAAYNVTVVNVLYKPEQARIWFSPNESTVNEGEALNMTCKAEANPKPYYTWSFKGNMIQSKINDTISFSSVTASDAGEYKCIAVNDLGSSTATKTLMVTYFRKPSCEAVPVIVKEGDNITLNCSASAHPPANYTWKSGNDIANRATAILPASPDLHDKSFTCTAANSRKSKNCTTAPLNVLYKPRYVRILAQALMVKEFGVVNLTCTTSSNPASNYTWTFNGKSIEGANSSLFVKYNVSRYDAGEYKCTASNSLGTAYNVTVVNVMYPPEFVCQEKLVVVEGQERNFSCNASAYPLPTYTVHYNFTIYSSKALLINLKRNDNGSIITCNASNSLGSAECKTVLIVTYKPEQARILFSPNESTVNEGEALTMTCKAEANPKPYYTWSFKGKMIQSKINDTISLSNVTANDAGEYTCIAVNDLGISTATKKLMVTYIGELTCEALPVIVKEGENITLNCSASAYPPANYAWKSGNDIANTSIAILTASRDLGKSFTCTAANSRGSKNCSTAHINVFYFNKNICKHLNLEWLSGNASRIVTYTTKGLGNPTPNLTCTSDVSFGSQEYNVTVNMTVPGNKTNYSCMFFNEVGNCSMTFTIWKRTGAYKVKCKVKIVNIIFSDDLGYNTSSAFLNLSSTIQKVIMDLYKQSGKEYLFNVYVINFVNGSVWVNFELELIANVPNPLQPLQDALVQNKGNLSGLMFNESSLSKGFHIPTTTSPISTTTISTTTAPPSSILENVLIGVGVAVAVLLLIVLIVLIVRYRKKKRVNRKRPPLVNNNDAMKKHTDGEAGARDNSGYSPSEYAERGPSHVEGGKEEPAYAAVDITKKTKEKKPEKKKPDEVTYASLEGFQPPGGRGGIVLEPLPKDEHTKMPDKYEETIYSEIIGTKKLASGNESAAGASNDIPLSDMHGQGTETESNPSDQTADPAKQNDQKPVTDEKEKPPDNQGQPPTKEDSAKPLSPNHPADSFPNLNGRNNTTMTTVSL